MNRAPVAAAATLIAVALLAGCDAAPLPVSTSGPLGSAPPSSSGPLVTAEPATFGPPPSPTPPDDASPITIDPTLLAFLPEAIDGIPVTEDLDVASDALLDQALPNIASGVDAAVAVDTGNGNLVTAWVVRLRPNAFGGEAFRQWRESYDEGACSADGGVIGNAEADIGGRTVYITSCVNALRTYHVWLEDQDVLVSASAIGQGRFGEQLMAGLRVPE